MEAIKVVARFADNRLMKGYTQDFFPNKSLFHIHPVDSTRFKESIEISVKDLKALFFVRDFQGNPDYEEKKAFDPKEQISGKKAEVTFLDGEVIVGTTLGYDPKRPGFFIHPLDTKSNNIRVFVVSSAVHNVRFP
jgi:hypothetical protein